MKYAALVVVSRLIAEVYALVHIQVVLTLVYPTLETSYSVSKKVCALFESRLIRNDLKLSIPRTIFNNFQDHDAATK